MVKTCLDAADRRGRGGPLARGRSTCARCPRSTSTRVAASVREDRPARRRARGADVPRHGRGDRRRGSPSSASTPWRRRCCGSAASTALPAEPARGGVPSRPRPRARRRRPLARVLKGRTSSSMARREAVQAARPRRGPDRGRDRHLAGQGRRHGQGQRHRRRDRDGQVAGRAAGPVRRRRSPTLLVAEGETVDVGTPIITVDTGRRRRHAPARGGGTGRAPRADEDEEIEAGKIGGAAPGGAWPSWSATAPRRPRPSAAPARAPSPPPSPAAAGRAGAPARPGRAGRRSRRHRAAGAARRAGAARPAARRALAKPPVRKLAKDLGVDLAAWPARARAASSPAPTSSRARVAAGAAPADAASRRGGVPAAAWLGDPASGRPASRSRACAR